MVEQVPEELRFFGKTVTGEPGVLVIAGIVKAENAIRDGAGHLYFAI